MQADVLNQLISPVTGEPLMTPGGGSNRCLVDAAGNRFPLTNGIARFVADDAFADSFGFQWNRFEVRQKEEDEATFSAKTGMPLEELSGKWVLDAGCGGGRYARVAAEQGARVIAVDRSSAVEKAKQLCDGLENVDFLQADLTHLPLRPGQFDLVFSIGVLHHSPDARTAFDSIARMTRPGGRLSVWVYRRATLPQEWINDLLRWGARKMSRQWLLRWCRLAAMVGGIPVLNKSLNKIVSFSAHPRFENRVCDTFDWYSPTYQSHHTVEEVKSWFRESGFVKIEELPPEKQGKAYRWAHSAGLLIGSGVNVTALCNR